MAVGVVSAGTCSCVYYVYSFNCFDEGFFFVCFFITSGVKGTESASLFDSHANLFTPCKMEECEV